MICSSYIIYADYQGCCDPSKFRNDPDCCWETERLKFRIPAAASSAEIGAVSSVIRVLTRPGDTATTVIPCSASSPARQRVAMLSPAFAIRYEYEEIGVHPLRLPNRLEILTTRLSVPNLSDGIKARVTRRGPMVSVENTRSISARVMFSIRRASPGIPALLMSRSTGC